MSLLLREGSNIMLRGLKKLLTKHLLAMVKESRILLLIREVEENPRGTIVLTMEELTCRGGIGEMKIGGMAGKLKDRSKHRQ